MLVPHDPKPRPHRQRRARWITRWKPALNAFAITFEGRIDLNNNNTDNRVYTVRLTLPPDTTVATYAYDDDEHLQSPTNASVGTTSYGYDAAGNLTTTTLPAGNDLASRPLKRTADLRGTATSTAEAVPTTVPRAVPRPTNLLAIRFTTHR